MTATRFHDERFTADGERIARMTGCVRRHVDARCVRRVIEIGSGGGEQLIALAEALPDAQLVGVDISQPNVDAANRTAGERGLGERVRFERADLADWQGEPADLVYSYSVLYLVPGDAGAVWASVARCVAPGGYLVNAMPYACGYNRMLHTARRVLRACRGRLTDGLLMWAARRSAGAAFDEDFYRQRLVYMYTLPERYVDTATHRLLAERHGLELVADEPERHSSAAQMKHRVFVYRRRPA